MLLQNILRFARYHFGDVGWVAMDSSSEVFWFKHKPEYDTGLGYWLDDSIKTGDGDIKLINTQGKSNLEFHEAIYKL